jgi:hypothetical protein
MAYGLEGWSSIPGGGKEFFSTPQRPDRFCSPFALLSNEYLSQNGRGLRLNLTSI